MLIISQRQLDLIADVRLRELHALLLERARRLFPVDVALMGDASLDEMVELALRRARKHRLDTTFDVFAYFDLMFALGSYFDSDPFLPWASASLTLAADGPDRMNMLREDALTWIEAATGDDGRPAIKAMLRAQSLSVLEVAQLRIGTARGFAAPHPDPTVTVEPIENASTGSDSAERIRTFLADMHPEKFRVMGVETVDVGVSEALHRADTADLFSPLGRHLFVLLSFMLGSGFARDPLFPWAAKAVRDVPVPDGTAAMHPSRRPDRATLLFDAAKGALAAAFTEMRTTSPG